MRSIPKILLMVSASTFFICACKPKLTQVNSENSRMISVDVNTIREQADVNAFIKSFDILELKETSGNIIGEAFKILKTEKNYIIFDKINSKRVVVFDNEGKFLKKPTDVGRSNKDPLQINDCWLTADNELRVYDFSQKNIFKYDPQFSLKKIERSPYDRVFTRMVNTLDGNFVGYKRFTAYNSSRDGENYKLALLSEDLALEEAYLPYDNTLNDALVPDTNNPLQLVGDEVRITEQYSGSVLSYGNAGLVEKYHISYSANALPADYETTILTPNVKLFRGDLLRFDKINNLFKGYYGFNGNWVESVDYIIFDSFDQKHRSFYSIYDKRSEKVICNAYTLYDSKTGTILPPFAANYYKGNEFVAVFPGYTLKYVVPDSSKFAPVIAKNVENNYIVNVKFK